MRILFLTPFPAGRPLGNSVTTERLARGLMDRGHDVVVAEADGLRDPGRLAEFIAHHAPHVVHAHHVWRSGRTLLEIPRSSLPPLVVSAGGTDLTLDAHRPDRRAVIREVIDRAAILVVSTKEQRRILAGLVDGRNDRIRRVPKGVALPPLPLPPPATPPEFLLAAGLRRVKNNRLALEALRPLAAEGISFRLRLAGSVIEPDYAGPLLEEVRSSGFASWIGEVPHGEMPALCGRATAVLNTSLAEGLANAVLEGMAAARPILASDIPANSEVVRHGETGFLCAGAEDFGRRARELMESPRLASELGARGRTFVEREHGTDAEIAGLVEAYGVAVARF